MSFSVVQHRERPHAVFFESDDVRFCVGSLNQGRKGWEFHYEPAANCLKEPWHAKLATYGCQQVELMASTERLTK